MGRLGGKILLCSFIFFLLSVILTGIEVQGFSFHYTFEQQHTVSLLFHKKEKEKDPVDEKGADVHEVVYQFGNQLKMVSLLAPDEILRESIREYYGDLVTPQLLKQWLENPRTVPGRYTSSPWPERIDILEVKQTGKDEYEVYGYIVEITSAHRKTGEIAAKRPITLQVIKYEERWLINKVELGDYK